MKRLAEIDQPEEKQERQRAIEKAQAAFDAANVSHGIHYPIPVHLQPAFADLGYKAGSFPITEALVSKIISLPMFPELTDNQIEQVSRACLKA